MPHVVRTVGWLSTVPGMASDLPIGCRVQVRRDPEFGPGPWPSEPTGTIAAFAGQVTGPRGVLRMYVVAFDQPQIDAEGDGPYIQSEVAHIYLEPFA